MLVTYLKFLSPLNAAVGIRSELLIKRIIECLLDNSAGFYSQYYSYDNQNISSSI